MKNEIYQMLHNFVDEHGGFSSQDFKDHPEIKENYNKFMGELALLDGKRVTISFTAECDFMSTSGIKTGKIRYQEGKVRFYEGKKRNRFYYLDAGLYEGWFATLIPMEITGI